jgi:redox-sensitive bicupin YhaK (pirin superfamily)
MGTQTPLLVAHRPVTSRIAAQPRIEGDRVHLMRAFGHGVEHLFDPFLMLDDFRAEKPEDWGGGFPWHPHRGIETITYMLRGSVEHRDSLGNTGVIGEGDVQWMTAGSGIVHQEMPEGDDSGGMGGIQLWINLPSAAKMSAPRYRSISAHEIPFVRTVEGALLRVIAGTEGGAAGPLGGTATGIGFLDVTLPEGAEFVRPVEERDTVFAYVIGGEADLGYGVTATNRTVVLFGEGDHVRVAGASAGDTRLLLFSGTLLREPIAWKGPVVMNTEVEVNNALREYREGTFVKVGSIPDEARAL